MTGNAVEWDRIPVIISFAEAKQMVETYGFAGSQGQTVLEGQRLVPRGQPSDTVYLFMHPASTLHLLPMPTALANAGAALRVGSSLLHPGIRTAARHKARSDVDAAVIGTPLGFGVGWKQRRCHSTGRRCHRHSALCLWTYPRSPC